MNDVFCKRREENSRDMSDRMMIVREHVDRLQGRYQLGKYIPVIRKHTSCTARRNAYSARAPQYSCTR
jgi:hypothetical protein